MAVGADTRINTVTGDRVPLSLLAANAPVHVFTWTGRKISLGLLRVQSAGRQPVTAVHLDDGSRLLVTSKQLAIARKSRILVNLDRVGLSLLPLYLGSTSNGYPTYCQQGTGRQSAPSPCDQRRWRMVSRLAYEWRTGKPIPRGVYLRHVDGNRQNSHPDNLRAYTGAKIARMNKGLRALLDAQEALAALEAQIRHNHKIVAIEPAGEEETFDLIGDRCSNVAVAGIFLHCAPEISDE